MKIKEKLRQFGILVIRVIWPARSKRGVHLGILLLALGLMIGVSQARTIQELISGSLLGGETALPDQKNAASTNVNNLASQPGSAAAPDTAAGETTHGTPNVVDLISDSELIVRGMVKKLSDGFDDGVPYTEVTVAIKESFRGKVSDEYTFRQFGLLKPRTMENGKVYLGVTPAGWAKYQPDEDVVLFLYKKASKTGLRTTVGLGQGKVAIKGGNAKSDFDNGGLFENVEADQSALTDSDKRLLSTKKGAVNAESFLTFVRKAVGNKWVEGGKLRNAKK